MPLFKKHHRETHDTQHGRHADRLDEQQDANYAAQQQPMAAQQPYGANQDAFAGQNIGATSGAGPTSGAMGYTGTQAPAAAPGSGLGGTGPTPAVPPASHINTQQPSATSSGGGGGGGAGSRLAGKAERAVGSLVGSQALKERGLQKEQEAGAFKMQSAEIAEAERLEKEALMRRERAVAHGAHPDNRHLGGMQNANTLADVTEGQQFGSGRGTY